MQPLSRLQPCATISQLMGPRFPFLGFASMAALVPLAMKKSGMNVSSHPATIHTPGKQLITGSPFERINSLLHT